MVVKIAPLTEADIPSAVEAIRISFAEDPYSLWIFNDIKNVSPLTDPLCSPHHEHHTDHNTSSTQKEIGHLSVYDVDGESRMPSSTLPKIQKAQNQIKSWELRCGYLRSR